MGIRILDHRAEVESWLGAEEPADAFQSWLKSAPPPVRMAFSPLPVHPGQPRWLSFVRERTAMLRRVTSLHPAIKASPALERVKDAIRRVQSMVDVSAADVEVHLLVGLAHNNACQGYWGGTGFAFIFLEQFLTTQRDLPLLGLGSGYRLGIWTAHELAHALRYSLLSTGSLVPRQCPTDDPFAFWEMLDRLPLVERFLDEGLATRVAADTYPEVRPTDLFYMSSQETDWLRTNAERLLADRSRRWDLRRSNPEPEWVNESLGLSNVWRDKYSLEYPPGRWGYYVGAELFVPSTVASWDDELRRSSHTVTSV